MGKEGSGEEGKRGGHRSEKVSLKEDPAVALH